MLEDNELSIEGSLALSFFPILANSASFVANLASEGTSAVARFEYFSAFR